MQDTILIIDDEADILSTLEDYFLYNDYRVITAANGREALEKAAGQPSLILLDINMPDIDGLEVCTRIREFVSCPILFLTARTEENDRIRGLGLGGDDYIVKPFSLEELGARVAAHLRRERRKSGSPKVYLDDTLAIDYTKRQLYIKEKEVALAKKEFDIIELLSGYAGQIFSKERIYERIWGYDSDGDSSVVAEHIRRIRVKMAKAGARPYVKTVWGVGYQWVK
ncbi:MAG: response regulator transcription factor [Lachnospiraceae bacterium]|nr:response regulator transcription factor [Lachnospiraceae bacterium]